MITGYLLAIFFFMETGPSPEPRDFSITFACIISKY